MATKKKSTAGSNETGHEYGISIEELETLMQTRDDKGIKELNERYGGLSGIEQKLKTNLLNGLSGDENDFSRRKAAFGRNEILLRSPTTFLALMFDALQDVKIIKTIIFGIILLTLSFYYPSGETSEGKGKPKEINVAWVEGIGIIIVVLVVILLTTFNHWIKERQFRDLQSKIELDQKFDVIRKSEIKQIPIKDILVGDICLIEHGDSLPADGLVVQSNNLAVDESSLTGESNLIKKHQSEDLFLLSGTRIIEGSGKMLVLAVGEHTQMGNIFNLLNAGMNNQNATEFQEVIPNNDNGTNNEDDSDRFKFEEQLTLSAKVPKLVNQITYAGIRIVMLIVLILLVPFLIEEFVQRREWNKKFCSRIVRYLITGITLLLVSVPESLPLTLTISLAQAVKKMMINNNLVRHLDALETIGCVTTICFDKTGLTTDGMSAVQVYVGEQLWHEVDSRANRISIPANIKEMIIEGLSVNTDYSSESVSSTVKETLPKQIGNKTECSLLDFVGALNGSYDEIRRNYPQEKFIHVYRFNSIRKSMSTVIQRPDSTVRMYIKGASDIILNKCTTILNQNGEIIPFSSIDYDSLEETVIEPMGSCALRTVCLAYRDFSPSKLPDWNDETNVVDQLTCICICGIENPVRPEVPVLITKCQDAGITVRMITGDNIDTARSIAIKSGIISNDDNNSVLDGKEFNRCIRSTPDGEIEQNLFDKVWPNLRVLARSSPQDKYELVKGIMASKINPTREVVAVTADGTNDAPVLKKADVGFAMGIQGTDAAKEASDIILVDDNLYSILGSIMFSRNIYHSIGKCLQFQLTVNVVIVLFAFIGSLIIKNSPLRDLQLLWIYLSINICLSLSFTMEVPTEETLKSKPYERTQPLISRRMMKNIIGHTIYQLIVLLFILLAGPKVFNLDDGSPVNNIFKPSQHLTMIFNVFVVMNLFNGINSRKIYGEKNIFSGIFRNPVFIIIWIVTFILQILLVQYGSYVFSCVALTFQQWICCLLFGVGVLLWNQVLNLIPLTHHIPELNAPGGYKPASPVGLNRKEQ
ncbi:unnamed protein product [Adineta steineri]|uniref:Calcium-transporting ATPase n=1 Tax=Adineta steineri TaxID=433720 RepID=A0A814VPT3_9BILA|nr:unnamed protein product [Adineta steineri]CAF1191215.1 unnamed protein product [Adineta steineri]